MKSTVTLDKPNQLPVDSPTRDDGDGWRYVLMYGSQATYADTISELVGEIAGGYDDLPDSDDGERDAFTARYDAACQLADLVQTGLVMAATEQDGWSPADVTEDELNALMQPAIIPFTPCTGADGTVRTEWRATVPLVAIDTDYEPYTQREAPYGNNVAFISPADEKDFLVSLDALGLCRFGVNDDAGLGVLQP